MARFRHHEPPIRLLDIVAEAIAAGDVRLDKAPDGSDNFNLSNSMGIV